ncbi:MAG: alpha/beta hydrolase [Rhodospirillales bacterium]|nr:alpha/beta hydrolase [Rhodospirillales bacterium]
MADQATPHHEIRAEDIEYLRHGERGLLARLYRPVGKGPFPAMVEVHGGAWVNNDRTQNETNMRAVAESGVSVLSVDFRMPPEAAYPASLQDINFAIRWMKAHAADCATTPSQIGGFGASSGGHQILLAALRPGDPRYTAIPGHAWVDASLAFVISAWGVLDPPARYALARERGNETMLDNHHRYWGDLAAMEDGSPPHILARGEKVAVPPALIFQGTAEEWTPRETAETLAAAWRQAGGTAETAYYEGERHGFMRDNPDSPNARAAIARVIAFAHRHGR